MRINRKRRKRVAPVVSTKAGAEAILATALKLYDRKDGDGANWRAVDEALFHAAFDVLDRLPDSQKILIARDVHARAYDRMVGNRIDAEAYDDSAARLPPTSPDTRPDHEPR